MSGVAGVPWLFRAVIVATLVACAPSSPECGATRTVDLLPEDAGPFAAGLRTWDVTYEAPGGVGPRTVKAYAWYPARDTNRDGTTYLGVWPDPDALVDATPEPPLDGCSYPVFAHSHGHQGFAGGAAHLMRHVASHGWVALGVDHTGNTIVDNVEPRPTALYYLRALDVSAVLDAVAALPGSDPLSKADVSKVVLSGHSFGVFTTWSIGGATFDVDAIRARCRAEGADPACTEAELQVFAGGVRDPRVVGIVPMAGNPGRDWFGVDGLKATNVPVLQMTGGEDEVGAADRWPDLVGLDAVWIELAGACHLSFDVGTCNTLEKATAFRIVDAYALAFARRHVLNDTSSAAAGLVDDQRPLSNLVTHRRR